MVVLNYSGEEINAKIVYYGPGLSGKTTNLEYIHEKMPVRSKGKLVSMKTRTDRTLFFDFLPLELGEINGYRSRFLLYTVPGQVYYNATRKLVLKGADAVVFVADSSPDKLNENIESLRNLEDNLNEHDLSLDHLPWVIQYNKRDLHDAMAIGELHGHLNLLGVSAFEAVATEGKGVYETFQGVAGLLFEGLRQKLERGEVERGSGSEPQTPGDGESVSNAVDTALREVDATGSDPEPAPLRTRVPASAPPPHPPLTLAAAEKTQHEQRAQSVGSPADESLVGQPSASAQEVRPPEQTDAPVDEPMRAPAPEQASDAAAPDPSFGFESLPDEPESSSDAHSTVRIEAAAAASEAVRGQSPPEFVIDPLGNRTRDAEEPHRDDHAATGTDLGDEVGMTGPTESLDLREEESAEPDEPLQITVPLVIPRSKLRPGATVTLRLDIQVIDS